MAKLFFFAAALFALFSASCSNNEDNSATSHYTFKTGSYIEAARNETFSLCPPQKAEGTWISEYSVSLNENNCISVQTPDLAGTFRILFLENSGYTDTIQVLVDQSYIQMGDYSHKIWVPDSFALEAAKEGLFLAFKNVGQYESRSYNQNLIVDKTMFTVADAWHYSEIDSSVPPFSQYRLKFSQFSLRNQYKNINLKESKLPYVDDNSSAWRLANERSKMEELDTAYFITTLKEARVLRDAGKVFFKEKGYHKYDSDSSLVIVLDTSASGYRTPTDEEWAFLMRAGASTRYYWGDEEDSLTVSRYAWFEPIGIQLVAQFAPNKFGLYDMIGIAWEDCSDFTHECRFAIYHGNSYYVSHMSNISGTPTPILSSFRYTAFRLMRKTPKLHKLEKF